MVNMMGLSCIMAQGSRRIAQGSRVMSLKAHSWLNAHGLWPMARGQERGAGPGPGPHGLNLRRAPRAFRGAMNHVP